MITPARVFCCVALLASLSPAQLISGFETAAQAPGTLISSVPGGDPEGWVSISGTQMIMPDGVNQVGPCALPIDGSSKWCEISPNQIGPANPVVPPSTPGLWPFVPGSVSEMQLSATVPIFPSLQTALSVDWYFMSAEGQNGSILIVPGGGYDDFAQVTVIDPSTQSVIATALYVDTWAPAFTAGVNTCTSGIDGITYQNQYGGPGQTSAVQIPSAFQGAPVIISVVAANQFDGNFNSVLHVDNLQWIDGSLLPPPFTLTATTGGAGLGDLTFGTSNLPQAASQINILVSATPAPGGIGTGLVFGLVPDGILIHTLFEPSLPGSLTHFPTSSDPYLVGPLSLPAGTLSPLAGQTWEVVAVAYNGGGLVQLSNYGVLAW